MKKIKLYYSIVDTYPPFRVDVADLFGNYIAKRNVEITWFMQREQSGANDTALYDGQLVNLPKKLKDNSLFKRFLNKLFYWLSDCVGLLKLLFQNVHIIQTRDKYIASLLGLLIARVKKIKYFYWCSYPFPELLLTVANNKKGSYNFLAKLNAYIAHFILYKVVMRFADHSFVQSKQMLDNIAAYGVSKNRMTAIPMGVPSRLINWANSNPTSIVKDRIVYVGTLDSIRHLDMLIDAFSVVYRQRPTATLVMVGEGVKSQDKVNLQRQVKRLGLDGAVTFTGFLPIEQAWTIAASAAVCVSPIYPSFILDCGSPTKLYEYMALARPVVCNHHPEQTYVINESGAGLCVDWGVEPFANAIEWLLNNSIQAEQAGKKGPAWIADNRAYSVISETVWHKYQEVLRESV
jgi:glycosyltransferase involved in cell wall biosynthesis